MGWSRPRLQTCQLSPRAGRPEELVNPQSPRLYGGYKCITRYNEQQQGLVHIGLLAGLLYQIATYCGGRSSFCCDELTDAHLPAVQQLHKRPIMENHL